ncbi:MAG: TRAP transporter small permease [Pseudomonadota bacterium]|jgi:C4-dicarboxylate transporter DctQ subunit|uniref:TRAP transporter small permease protein n=1 Tax=Thalassococcus halodurans TaxID=373675 RepID=A0A1H5SDF0_9RHOB|nr:MULTISPECIES: TRAP transporter small permease [Thalassococcus]MBO6865690.1 TRAP transporter small permease [Thalassococcus sp.]MEC7668782.1 TRAP transporter small permease [Pseudomonadota bacterium]MEC8580956.1 TRAP transporter small permease [Pseudomonadota bacterium]SEF48646.1 C4-dicarboxylate transporter, DctQ subunit [Thalassococcus halodurans]
MSSGSTANGAVHRFVNELEESVIAIILGLMTLITFVNVVLRYGFNTGLIWGLEATSLLFAWLVLFGVSYCVKVTAHLGVDAVVNILPTGTRRVVTLFAGAVCLAYAFLLFKGAWDYWANFANLPQTTGRWFPTGFEEMKRTSYRAWYETIDIPIPDFLRWIEPLMNEGESYEKLPRFIPYAMLPFGAGLLLFRFAQAFVRLWKGTQSGLIVSHEAEDAVEDVAHMNREG